VTTSPEALPSTVADGIERALESLEGLEARGLEIADEWQYVTDLRAAWVARLRVVTATRGAEPLDPAVVDAIEAASAEAARVTDPHRAIDWLSTFPQVVLVALGEQP
jgi:hypothetical protein